MKRTPNKAVEQASRKGMQHLVPALNVASSIPAKATKAVSQKALHAAQSLTIKKPKWTPHKNPNCSCIACRIRRGDNDLKQKLAAQGAAYRFAKGNPLNDAVANGSKGGIATAERTRAVVSLSEACKEVMELADEDLGQHGAIGNPPANGKRTVAQSIAMSLARAARGLYTETPTSTKEEVSVAAAKELREVTEGKLTEKRELTGKDGAPLNSLTPIVLQVNFIVSDEGKPYASKDSAGVVEVEKA